MLRLDKRILLGILITFITSVSYVLMSALSKMASVHLPINTILFLQSIAGLLCAIVFVKVNRYQWRQIFHEQRLIYLVRVVMSLASIYTLIYGLKYVSIFNALVIMNMSPLILPFLRKLFFKSKIHSFMLPSALLAFVGIMLILGPDHHILSLFIVFIGVSMLCMTLSLLLLEKTQHTDPKLSIFYYFMYSSLVTGLLVLTHPQALHLSTHGIRMGSIIGILFFIVQVSVVYAARYISSQLMSVLFYSEIIMSLIVSVVFENLQMTGYILAGTIFVLLGGVVVVFIENHTKRNTEMQQSKPESAHNAA